MSRLNGFSLSDVAKFKFPKLENFKNREKKREKIKITPKNAGRSIKIIFVCPPFKRMAISCIFGLATELTKKKKMKKNETGNEGPRSMRVFFFFSLSMEITCGLLEKLKHHC